MYNYIKIYIYKYVYVCFSCLNLMEKQRQGIAHHILDIAFDNSDPLPSNFSVNTGPSQWYNENLDQSQRDAVSFALASRDMSIIHGPPGTGKYLIYISN